MILGLFQRLLRKTSVHVHEHDYEHEERDEGSQTSYDASRSLPDRTMEIQATIDSMRPSQSRESVLLSDAHAR